MVLVPWYDMMDFTFLPVVANEILLERNKQEKPMLRRLVVGGGWLVGFVSVLVAASLVVNQYFTPHYKQ